MLSLRVWTTSSFKNSTRIKISTSTTWVEVKYLRSSIMLVMYVCLSLSLSVALSDVRTPTSNNQQQVDYTVEGFCVANKDILLDDLAKCLESSQSDMIASFVPKTTKKSSTSGSKIKRQTGKLVKTLMAANPHYVRCIKSNDEKRKDYIDQSRVKFQCKYLGLLENIKVRRAGFAYRSEFHRFHERFKLLSSSTYPRAFRGSDRDACDAIVRDCQSEIPELSDEAQLGKSKVFIKRPVTFFQLERMRTNQLNMYVYLTPTPTLEYALECLRSNTGTHHEFKVHGTSSWDVRNSSRCVLRSETRIKARVRHDREDPCLDHSTEPISW